MAVLIAFIIALAVALLTSPGYRRDYFVPLAVFFIVLFLAALAGQFWIVPFGPLLWGISWMSVLFSVLIVAFLLAAAPPSAPAKDIGEAATTTTAAAMSTFIWLLIWR